MYHLLIFITLLVPSLGASPAFELFRVTKPSPDASESGNYGFLPVNEYNCTIELYALSFQFKLYKLEILTLDRLDRVITWFNCQLNFVTSDIPRSFTK